MKPKGRSPGAIAGSPNIAVAAVSTVCFAGAQQRCNDWRWRDTSDKMAPHAALLKPEPKMVGKSLAFANFSVDRPLPSEGGWPAPREGNFSEPSHFTR
jgi:hypothetical protein